MRPALKAYVVCVLATGLAFALAYVPGSSVDALPLAAALLVIATIAQLRPIHLTQKMKMTVDDTATFAAALLLSPGLALLVAAGATLLAYARRRQSLWFEGVSNASRSGLAAFTAAAVFAALGGDRGSVASYAPAAVAAAGVMYLMHTGLVDIAVALQLRRDPFTPWWPVHRRDLPQSVALYALGGLMAIVADAYPVAILLFALPMAGIFASMRETARLRTQTREAIVEMANLIDQRDQYTHGHSRRVADLAAPLAAHPPTEPSQGELIPEAGPLPHLGEIRTP